MYQIVDSLEDDQEELTATEVSDRGRRGKSKTKEAEKEDTPTCGSTALEASEKMVIKEETLYEIVDDLEEVTDEGSGTGENERKPKDIKKGDKSTTKSQSDTATLEEEKKQKSPKKNDTTSALVNLDEVSEEEEDYPDDAAEEEELRKRQAATKKKQFAKEREARRARERDERARRSGSNSSSRGGGDRGGTRRTKERGRENEEKVEVDAKELVTLDEVGPDEAGEERAPESQEWDGEITEGELQALVTLDEFVEEEEEEEEEEGKAERSTLETRPLSQDDESVDSLNPEVKVKIQTYASLIFCEEL